VAGTAPADAARITSGGNLLVGTTSDNGYKFATIVAGSASFQNAITMTNATDSDLSIRIRTNETSFINSGNTAAFTFATNSIERARIDSSGNFMLGTTGAIQGGTISSFFDGQTRNGIVLQTSFTSGGTGFIRFVNSADTAQGEITANSTTTVTYGTSSDYRLKTVIGPVANAGQRIDALQPVEYTWNSNGERNRGFLAHQFQEVYAGSVSGTKDAVDAEGKPVYQSMQASTSEVIADLVAEIQDLRKRLAAAGI
jgi:hypothetical protein